jgi:hypothetical protein
MTENREPLNLNTFLPPDHTLTIEPREDPDEARYRRRREERTWWFVIVVVTVVGLIALGYCLYLLEIKAPPPTDKTKEWVRSLFSTLVAAFVVGGMGYLVGKKSKY